MFPIGVTVNSLSIVLGGIVGALFGGKFSAQFKDRLSSIFGVCSLMMGINAVILAENQPAVIFSVIVGTAIGIVIHFGDWIENGARGMQKQIARLTGSSASSDQDAGATALLVTVIVLFCASGTGIYGSIDAGMTGNNTILFSKSILDFFTALIFACQLGMVIPLIALPQFVIFSALFFCAKLIFPLVTPAMINDFKACGGVLLLATAFRMLKLSPLPTADMIIGMVIVMPVSWAWVSWIMPLL